MIGIDLGTTNSLVAIFENGQPRVLQNELGEDLTPSIVAIAQDGQLLVGRAAKDRLISDPQSGVAAFKRDMGTNASYRFGGKSWNPISCSALILQEMKRIAENHLGSSVDKAVITVPAYFHDQQRQATIEAAKIAGITVERIINEPTAAALAYGYRNPDEEKKLLVFDLGGGTFDVTLLEIFEGVIEVKSSAGESRLGGEDYTDAFANWLENTHKWKPSASQLGAWRQRVELAKRKLSSQDVTSIFIHEKLVEVSRKDLLLSSAEISARIRPIVSRCLRDANLQAADLEDVLLVGGASRMTVVREFIQDTLKRIPNQKIDPDRVVALGAAVQAGLCANDSAVSDLVLTDVSPHTLGIETVREFGSQQVDPGYFAPIIDRNTTVPVSRSKVFSTLHPKQEFIQLKIFQGESRMTRDNQMIGEVKIQGLEHKPNQKHPGAIDVRFSYDMNGILEVEVTALSSEKVTSLIIEQRPGILTKAQIQEAISRMKPLKLRARDLLPHRARLERANRLFAELIGPAREQLTRVTENFESALDTEDSLTIKQSAAVLDSFLQGFFEHEKEQQHDEQYQKNDEPSKE